MSYCGVSTGTPTASIDSHVGPHERQDDVEIVNHQVEHDVDVEAAIRERAQPMHLDEARRRDQRQHGRDGRVVSFRVPDARASRRRRARPRPARPPRPATGQSAFRRGPRRRARETAARCRGEARSAPRSTRRRPCRGSRRKSDKRGRARRRDAAAAARSRSVSTTATSSTPSSVLRIRA